MVSSLLSQGILAFDYGSKRIGVAIKKSDQPHAEPLTTLANDDQLWPSVRVLLRTYRPDLLVVGWPRTLDGNRSDQTIRSERFAEQLKYHTDRPVKLVDEHTSTERARTLLPKGLPITKTRAMIDQYAAAVILQDFLHDAR